MVGTLVTPTTNNLLPHLNLDPPLNSEYNYLLVSLQSAFCLAMWTYWMQLQTFSASCTTPTCLWQQNRRFVYIDHKL